MDHSDQKAKALLFCFQKSVARISGDRVGYLVLVCNLVECWGREQGLARGEWIFAIISLGEAPE